MAHFNSKGVDKTILSKVLNVIRNDIKIQAVEHFNSQLNSQQTATGEPLPKKDKSTVDEYRQKGWNTSKWLVRTGNSTRLISKNISGGISISPQGKDKLRYVKKASEWFAPNKELKDKIISTLKYTLR